MEESIAAGFEPSAEQQAVATHGDGPLLVLGGAGSGRSEALARRAAALAAGGVPVDRILVLTHSRAAAVGLRERIGALIDPAHEELWVGTFAEVSERLLSEYALEAGLDPFVVQVSKADRLAILLDRLDDLPLRRHEIRGNPAGLLARLLGRIDALKGEGILPGRLREWAEDRLRSASTPAERASAQREVEFADFFAAHDRILRERSGIDAGDLALELARLIRDREDVRAGLAERFPFVLVDELEDSGAAHRALVVALGGHRNVTAACDPSQGVRALLGSGRCALAGFRAEFADATEVELSGPLRFGGSLAAAAAALAGEEPAASPEDGSVRLWRASGERAQEQAAARSVEQLIASGEVRPEGICVIAGGGWREARLVAAAFEERGVPFRFLGDGALFQRPEVRDALAWLRLLADSGDAAAVVRAVTRPPIELRSGDLARCTTIARRRKLDMVAALEAALESPQLGPEARDRIQAFLKLRAGAAAAMEEMRPDAFVRRLVERIGLRRHRLFAATPETAERLQSLARLAERATEWSRREPRGSVRDFIRQVTAVADAGDLDATDPLPPPPGAVVIAEPEQVKGLEFDHVFLVGMSRAGISARPWEDAWVPAELASAELPVPGPELAARRRAELAYVCLTRARRGVVLSRPATGDDGTEQPSHEYELVRDALGGEEEVHAEELFGPAEGLHATYRLIRDEVLEASWKAGSALSEMRLDTAEDVNDAIARYLELLKLAALIQRPGEESTAEALASLNDVLSRIATPEQRAALERSSLDEYIAGEERERGARRDLVGASTEPGLQRFIPRRGEGLALSASDIDLYRTCPLKYKFARVFAIPQEPTINQRFGILVHQVLDRFHKEELRQGARPEFTVEEPGSLDRLLALFEGGWRRTGFGASDDELQYRDRAVAALARYHEHHTRSAARPVWLERTFSFAIGPHQLRGRVDRVDRLPDGGYELIDYKTGGPKDATDLVDDVQIPLYRLGARAAWEVEPEGGAYWYVLDDERVTVPSAPDDAERVERTVLEVAAGIEAQDFEPRPSYEICSWCDYRLICPASEA
jgi:DNA helicase-2/ATP-dependent DNA helicase PcrA